MADTNTRGERPADAYRRMLVLSGCPGAKHVLPHVVTLPRHWANRLVLKQATAAWTT